MASNLPVVRFRCDQRFDDLAATGTPGVGFCAQCQKNVLDFRGRSAAHVRAVHRAEIAAGRGTPCGAYDRLFVETPLPPESGLWRRRWTGWLAALGLGAPLGLAGCATERPAAEPVSFASTVETLPGGSRCGTRHARLVGKTSTDYLRGVIVDEHGDTVIGANVFMDNERRAVTNVDGQFRLDRIAQDTTDLVSFRVTYIGYKPLHIQARWGQYLRLVLHEDGIVAGEIVVVQDDGVEEGMESRGGVTTVLHRGLETIRRVVYPHR